MAIKMDLIIIFQPFWPTGSGCARGFLGVLDCCHMISEWCQGSKSVLQVLVAFTLNSIVAQPNGAAKKKIKVPIAMAC